MVTAKITGDVVERLTTNGHSFLAVSVKRKSGTADIVFVRDDEGQLYGLHRLSIEGQVITKRFTKDTRKIWYVDGTATDVKGGWKNELTATNLVVSEEPKIRTTPAGKKVIEVTLNCLDNKCYVYAIAFNDYAEKLYSDIKKGDKLVITKGRLQSRWYGPEDDRKMVNEILINEAHKEI